VPTGGQADAGHACRRARRHAERLTGLDDAELSTFARRARDLVASVTDVTGAPALQAEDVKRRT
jgi:hypothetical protein